MRWEQVDDGAWAGRPVTVGDQFLMPHSQGNETCGPAAECDAFNPRPLCFHSESELPARWAWRENSPALGNGSLSPSQLSHWFRLGSSPSPFPSPCSFQHSVTWSLQAIDVSYESHSFLECHNSHMSLEQMCDSGKRQEAKKKKRVLVVIPCHLQVALSRIQAKIPVFPFFTFENKSVFFPSSEIYLGKCIALYFYGNIAINLTCFLEQKQETCPRVFVKTLKSRLTSEGAFLSRLICRTIFTHRLIFTIYLQINIFEIARVPGFSVCLLWNKKGKIWSVILLCRPDSCFLPLKVCVQCCCS